MPLFQKTVISKYLKSQNTENLKAKWDLYCAHFKNPTIQENIRGSKEEQYQEGFLRDLFVNILGYKLNPADDFNLTTELKNVKDSKKADGAILLTSILTTGEEVKKVSAIIELKGTNTTDLSKIETQAFGYKNNQDNCKYVITSNFEKLRFYIENAIEHIEFNLFELSKENFNLLYLCLAFENIKNDIPYKIKEESLNQEDIITKKLYKDYSVFKRELFQNLTELNPEYEALELFQKSQKLLDRMLFLFFGEDRGLLPPNSVRKILEQWNKLQELDEYTPLYNRYKKYFGYLNTGYKGKFHDVFAYNGGLFKADAILDNIKIDDDLLYKHTFRLSEYDFASEVDVNILGHIFENSLNELDEIKAQLNPTTENAPSISKRKKDGVFYTPKYITKYIVENTVGKLCSEKKAEFEIVEEEYFTDKKRQEKTKKLLLNKLDSYRNWLLKITICDPACGSGAFLNEALNFLITEHQYIDELEAKLLNVPIIFSYHSESILENNLFGVDINEESVEIAKLSLWLRTAEPNRKLNSLNDNIKCGNSLIDDAEVAGNKAFNWQKEFPQVFKEKDKKAFHVTTALHDSRTSQRMLDYKVREKRFEGTKPNAEFEVLTEEEEFLITQTIAEIKEKDNLHILSYNICRDHLHLLLVCEETELKTIMQKIKSVTARKVNINRGVTIPREHAPLLEKRGTTQNSLWTQKFDKREVQTSEELMIVINYIDKNRSKHKLPEHSRELKLIIEKRIICSLERAFSTEFDGGFDVVIGNPPYVLMQPSNTDEKTLQYYKTFKVASYKIDLFHLFFEKSIIILKQKGKLGFITPNTYLNNKFIKSLRLFILQNTLVNSIINYRDAIFSDAGVDVATIILTISNENKNNKIETFEVENTKLTFLGLKEQNDWFDDKENLFNLNKSFLGRFANCITLKDICTSYFGIQAYDRKSSISNVKENENYLQLIDGGDINEFSYSIPNKYFNFLPERIKSGGNFNVYNEKRIVVSQIGFTPIVGLCEAGIVTSNTLYNINIFDDSYNLNYVLCILTSKLLKNFWQSKYSDGKKLFPKIKGFQLKELPIKIADKLTQQPFIEKADKMLSLNKELQEITRKFQRTLTREHAPLLDTLPKKLQSWYELSYADFLKELKKKKVELSLSQKAEWEEYFHSEKQKAISIKNEIDATDKAIDKMVYELYGLNEEEIMIVENN